MGAPVASTRNTTVKRGLWAWWSAEGVDTTRAVGGRMVVWLLGCVGPDGGTLADAKAVGPDMAGIGLLPEEVARIAAELGPAPFPAASVADPVFVLHDTASFTSESASAAHAHEARGPLGIGPAVFVASSGVDYVARPYFDRWRPSSTLWERAEDVATQPTVAQAARALWAAVPKVDREAVPWVVLDALEEAYPGEPHAMTAAEVDGEALRAIDELNGTRGGDRIYTTAMWTTEHLTRAWSDRVAVPSWMHEYFDRRADRLGRVTNLELGQIAGSHCLASGTRLQAYSDGMIDAIAKNYLQSAVVAGTFPRLDTHFAVDAAFYGHCDPRCLDIGRVNRAIARVAGHDEGTTYGLVPNYGTTWGVHNVWWSTAVCGPKPS